MQRNGPNATKRHGRHDEDGLQQAAQGTGKGGRMGREGDQGSRAGGTGVALGRGR